MFTDQFNLFSELLVLGIVFAFGSCMVVAAVSGLKNLKEYEAKDHG